MYINMYCSILNWTTKMAICWSFGLICFCWWLFRLLGRNMPRTMDDRTLPRRWQTWSEMCKHRCYVIKWYPSIFPLDIGCVSNYQTWFVVMVDVWQHHTNHGSMWKDEDAFVWQCAEKHPFPWLDTPGYMMRFSTRNTVISTDCFVHVL